MPEPDIDPLVKAKVEDRAHAINQMIIDARLAEAPFPGEHLQNVINLSVADKHGRLPLLPLGDSRGRAFRAGG